MDGVRYVKAPLKIFFQEGDKENKSFKREYDELSQVDDDSVGQWLKLAKARGETRESDQILMTLLVELHRKVDYLTSITRDEDAKLLQLKHHAKIESIGYGYFRFEDDTIEDSLFYYGRIEVPVFPKREMPVFFKALNSKEAQIVLMHEQDEKDWGSYLVARERIMIREMKGRENDD
ncbi:MAG: hypothetical protein PHN38_00240 [Sulfurospirillaceae bacterium]|nr:hypothetical protein [Sulfurospirillaceae bacterium]MDD3462212.1 hypothetical protein [Sulfurospirillaceae bacterium]